MKNIRALLIVVSLLFLAGCNHKNIVVTSLIVPPCMTTSTQTSLTWDVMVDPNLVSFYEVYQNDLLLTTSTITNVKLKDLTPETTYHFQVRACMADGSRSDFTPLLEVTTKPTEAVVDVTSYGAVGDGVTLSTEAIQQAIEECPIGGIVRIPAGVYLSGALYLKDNMTLYLADNAILQGSDRLEDYLPFFRNRFEGWELDTYAGLLNCGFLDSQRTHMTRNVAIRGNGIIRGAGRSLGRLMWDTSGERTRGRLLCFMNCRGVAIEGVTFDNPPSWMLHFIYCQEVTCANLDLRSLGVPNGDGIDPDSSTDFYIYNCSFTNGDDCIAIKSGKNPEGNRINLPSSNIQISHCEFLQGHGISIGSEISGGISDVVVRSCKAGNLWNGLQIKATRERGGYVRDVDVRDCALRKITVYTSLLYNNDGASAPTPPKFSNFTFERINMCEADVSRPVVILQGFPETEYATQYLQFTDIELPIGASVEINECHHLLFKNVRTTEGGKPNYIINESNEVVY